MSLIQIPGEVAKAQEVRIEEHSPFACESLGVYVCKGPEHEKSKEKIEDTTQLTKTDSATLRQEL